MRGVCAAIAAIGLSSCVTLDNHPGGDLSESCSAGKATACFDLSKLREEHGDRRGAVEALDRACNGGVPEGCFNLGLIVATRGQRINALGLQRKSCELGFAGACAEWGLLETELGNPEKAESLYRRACDGKSPIGCNRLGTVLFAAGKTDEAKRLFQFACDRGERAGCENAQIRIQAPATKPETSGIVTLATRVSGIFERGRCYPAFPLNYSVVQKLDDKLYVAVRSDNYGQCVITRCHAIVELNSYDPRRVGPLNTLVEWVGTRALQLSNGFESEADLLRECKETHPCGERGQSLCSGKSAH